MLGLAIHTCGPNLGLALGDIDSETRHQTWPLNRELSTHLHSLLMEFIAPHRWQDFTYLAVAQGPGGFTGTRIGVVTARTLAQQLEIPLFGVSSLAAVAQQSIADQSQAELSSADLSSDRAGDRAPDIAVEMQAQRGQLYTAIYRPTAEGLAVVLPDQVHTPADWEATLAAHPHPLDRVAVGDDLAATVAQVLALAGQRWRGGDRPQWSTVVPYYGQHPVDR
jgi:tRNA threonylcarbamoyl adenosine modification protein YeaZ